MILAADACIGLSVDGVAARLVLRRPSKANALTFGMIEAIRRAVREAADDPAVGGLVMEAEGPRHFSAGMDGQEVARDPAGCIDPLFGMLRDLVRFPKPTVAAVQGTAVGAGALLALCLDFQVAASDVAFRIPEIDLSMPSFAALAIAGGAVGEPMARHMVLTGQTVTAATLQRSCATMRLVDDRPVGEAAAVLIATLCGKPLDVYGALKRSIARDRIRALDDAACETRGFLGSRDPTVRQGRPADA